MEKNTIGLMAETLLANGLTIENYELDYAIEILTQNNFDDEQIEFFNTNAFHVYVQLMHLEMNKPQKNNLFNFLKK